ncbi:hypothetical protein [Oligoflexus tunisiensis]|uniref:hypothetical protein n=1 Tax=Oligoflexus tunisiensis TaxID=708132 RepID=UPI00114CBDA6|nr:hypothetical protein [Oligoflexus tunisiensis]
MQRLMPGLLIFVLAGVACQKESESATEEAVTETAQTAEQQPVTQEPVTKEPVKEEPEITCDSLSIPSYELWIRDLSELRCDSCHNDKIAFNGIKFLTYEGWVAVAEAAKIRIETNRLTRPLDPIEQRIFLKWFDNGMPRLESDCADKG